MFFEQFTEYDLQFHGVRLPEIKISDEAKLEIGADKTCNNYTYLAQLCHKGFEEKLKKGQIDPKDSQKYTDRCKLELDVFKKHKLVDYVLLVYDILNWCDKNDIARGVARGSASGSCVFYLLGCNKISPLKHSLPFTRFISEARMQSKEINGITWHSGKSLPDYDADISYLRRSDAIKYVDEKFIGKTSKIGTLITYTGKILIKECCKIYLEYNEQQAQEVSELVERHFGKVEKLADTYKDNKEFKKWVDESNQNTECFYLACSIENCTRAKGQHPSGLALSFDKIDESIPLELSPGKEVVTGYDMEDVAEISIKLDILGLKNTDVNQQVCKMVGIDMDTIDINHPSIYKYFQNSANFYGLFQIESGLTKKTVIDVKPKNIDQLACCISLSRPGTYKDIPKYLKYVHEGVLESIYPVIDKCLKDTANILLYQEEVTKLCVDVYGMDEISADQIRYSIGKKKREDIKKWEPILFQKGEEKEIPKEVTKQIWQTIQDSADYQFSMNHAYSYSYTTAINTYLKVNYPKEFYVCLLNMAKHEPNSTEVFGAIIEELPYFGIELLGPDLLKSDMEFKIEGNNIRFSLSGIKGVAEKSFAKLQNFKHKYSTKFEVFESANEIGLNVGLLSATIQAGCLSDFPNISRSKMVLEAQTFNLLTPREKKRILELGPEYNYDLLKILKDLTEKTDIDGKLFIKPSRLATIRRKYDRYKQIYLLNSKHEKLSSYFYEKTLLGFSYSQKLDQILKETYPDIMTIQEVQGELNESRVIFCGETAEVKYWTARTEKKTKCCKLKIKDSSGSMDVLLFNDAITFNEEQNAGKFAENQILVIKGTKKSEAVFANQVTNQNVHIYCRLSDLKEDKSAEKEDEKIKETA